MSRSWNRADVDRRLATRTSMVVLAFLELRFAIEPRSNRKSHIANQYSRSSQRLPGGQRIAGQQILVRARDDVRRDEFADLAGGLGAGVDRRPHAADIAAYNRR